MLSALSGIAIQCLALSYIPTLFCTFLHRLLPCIVLRCPPMSDLFCILHCPAWSCTIMHCLADSCTILHCPPLSYVILHCLALPFTVLHYAALFFSISLCPVYPTLPTWFYIVLPFRTVLLKIYEVNSANHLSLWTEPLIFRNLTNKSLGLRTLLNWAYFAKGPS
jgi:hypothetical protein